VSTTWTAEEDRAFRSAVDGTPISAEENGRATVLEVVTARDLCKLPDPPASDELLGNLIARRQRTVVGADTGAGKTTFTLEMLGGIVTQREILGFKGAGGRALVIDAEQGLKTIKRRLRETGLADSELVDYIRVPDGLSLDSDEAEASAVERRLAEGGYVVVLADPPYKLHRGDSNGEREAVDLMRRFDGWRERYEFALLLNVHIRKPPAGAKFSMHEFFGSSAYLRGAEVVLGLQRVRDGYSRLHFFKDREGDLPVGSSWGLLFDRDSGFRRDPEDEKPRQTTADQVRELLAGQPGMTIGQLVEETGKAERTVRSALKEIGANDDRPGTTADKLWTLA
jgi:AAA domain